jgi:hypothetical protein
MCGIEKASQKKGFIFNIIQLILAERVGFEPTEGYKPSLVFKTSAFNRSATSPVLRPDTLLAG